MFACLFVCLLAGQIGAERYEPNSRGGFRVLVYCYEDDFCF